MSRCATVTGSFGASVTVDVSRMPSMFRVCVFPTGGDTVTVETSVTPTAYENPGAARWIAWTAGAVTAATQQQFAGRVVAVRFTRTVGANTSYYEIAG